jgi:hypothetical protein
MVPPSIALIEEVIAPFEKTGIINCHRKQTKNFQRPTDSWFWFRAHSNNLELGLVVSKQGAIRNIAKFRKSTETDIIGNSVYLQTGEIVNIHKADLIRKVQVTHHCLSGCEVTETGVSHEDQERFVVNSYNFDEWEDDFPRRVLDQIAKIRDSFPYSEKIPRRRLRTTRRGMMNRSEARI